MGHDGFEKLSMNELSYKHGPRWVWRRNLNISHDKINKLYAYIQNSWYKKIYPKMYTFLFVLYFNSSIIYDKFPFDKIFQNKHIKLPYKHGP